MGRHGPSCTAQRVLGHVLLLLLVAQPASNAAATPLPEPAANSSSKASKPVIIVLGTAGSGTRTVHQILAAAGVWMHPQTNPEFDSKLFIRKVKHTPPFGMPGRSHGNTSFTSRLGMIWETRHCPANYEPEMLSEDVRQKLSRAHEQVAAEFLRAVPDDAPVWAWKEPQAIFTLPFLVKVFPNLHIIHQTRDGRDVAMSNLNSTSRRTTRPYQRHYIKTITGQEFNTSELLTPRFSVAAGETWSAVNANARRWLAQHGLGLQGRYSLTRLEDFCDTASLPGTIATLLGNAGVAYNDSVIAQAAGVINTTKCQTARWQAAWESNDTQLAAAMRAVDAGNAGALELFKYEPALPRTAAADSLLSQLRKLGLLQPQQPGATQRPPLVVVFVAAAGEQRLLQHWLSWLRRASVNTSRVLLAVQGDAAAAMVATAAAAQAGSNGSPLVLQLPHTGPDEQQLAHQLHLLHALVVSAQQPVLLSEVTTVWQADASAHITALQHNSSSWQAGHDLVATQAAVPVAAADVLQLRGTAAGDARVRQALVQGLATGGGRGVGLLFLNATRPAGALLRGMMQQLTVQQQQQQLKNRSLLLSPARGCKRQHRQGEQPSGLLGLLREQLLLANLAFSRVPGTGPAAAGPLLGREATTAPSALRVLFLGPSQVQDSCRQPQDGQVLAVACGGAGLTAAATEEAEQRLRKAGLWSGPAAAAGTPVGAIMHRA